MTNEAETSEAIRPGARRIMRFAAAVMRRMQEQRLTLAAAGVAYYGVLAVVPILLALATIYGRISLPSELASSYVLSTIPADVRELLLEQLASLTQTTAGVTWTTAVVGFAVGLWAAGGALTHALEGIELAYGRVTKGSWIVRRGRATLRAAVSMVAVVGGLVLLGLAPHLMGDPTGAAATVVAVLRWPLAGALFFGAAWSLYRYGPRSPLRGGGGRVRGAAVAAVVATLGSWGLGLYFATIGSMNATYGVLGGFMVLLMWSYLISFGLLLGAAVHAASATTTPPDVGT